LTRYLVTGCAGFIGSQLAEALLAGGHTVLGIDCFNDNYGRADKLSNLSRARDWDGFEFVPIDLARGQLEDLVDEADTVFHLAAEPGVRSSWGGRFETYVRNNVLATQCLLEAAKRHPRKRVVLASSSSVYGNAETLPTPESATPRPFSPYGMTKLAAEHLCDLYHGNYGVDTVALRYFSVYGPRQRPDMAFNRFCRAAIAGTPVTVYGDGRQTRDFTFVADVVRATRMAAQATDVSGRVYNIGGGGQVSVAQALELIEGYAGRPLAIKHLAAERGDVRDTGADTSRARAELSFEPTVPLEDGLREEFEWALSTTHARELARV
jgi:UDP-glucuronate 4-epimerase